MYLRVPFVFCCVTFVLAQHTQHQQQQSQHSYDYNYYAQRDRNPFEYQYPYTSYPQNNYDQRTFVYKDRRYGQRPNTYDPNLGYPGDSRYAGQDPRFTYDRVSKIITLKF